MAHQEIYQELSAKGLIGLLVTRVREFRPKASRNTIHLALQEGGTTPTRVKIIEIAHEVLATSEQTLTEEVPMAL